MSDCPLFPDMPEALSPRLDWLWRHKVETEQIRKAGDLDHSPEKGDDIPVWVCRVIKSGGIYAPNEIGGGDTEAEAILDFCEASGVPHWLVEEAKK